MNDAALAERRRRRLWMLGSTLVVAAVLVGIVVALNHAGGDEAGTTTGTPEGIADTRALFAGIPQRGIEVGSPRAPVTLVEFADIQCPFCGRFARDVLPDLVRRYVRPGKVKLVFRGLAFLGPDSETGARMAAAAGQQRKLWQFVDLLYRNQGSENSGWVNDPYLRRLGRAVGLDVERALAARETAPVTAQLDEAKAEAGRAGVKATPSFLIGRGAATPQRVDIGSLSVGEFTGKLDDALRGG